MSEEVFGACAGGALYRRAMLDAVGGFDTSFFAYLEDADLAWRARMGGWRSVYAPAAVMLHDHSATLGHRSRQKYLLVGRNRVRMLAKNATRQRSSSGAASAMVAYDLAYVLYVGGAQRDARAAVGPRARASGSGVRTATPARPNRRAAALAQPRGLRAALRRDRAYG